MWPHWVKILFKKARRKWTACLDEQIWSFAGNDSFCILYSTQYQIIFSGKKAKNQAKKWTDQNLSMSSLKKWIQSRSMSLFFAGNYLWQDNKSECIPLIYEDHLAALALKEEKWPPRHLVPFCSANALLVSGRATACSPLTILHMAKLLC